MFHYSLNRFDTSKGRGPLKTEIGVGKVIIGRLFYLAIYMSIAFAERGLYWCWLISGWDEGVQQMTLGEKAILTISRYVGLTLSILSCFF